MRDNPINADVERDLENCDEDDFLLDASSKLDNAYNNIWGQRLEKGVKMAIAAAPAVMSKETDGQMLLGHIFLGATWFFINGLDAREAGLSYRAIRNNAKEIATQQLIANRLFNETELREFLTEINKFLENKKIEQISDENISLLMENYEDEKLAARNKDLKNYFSTKFSNESKLSILAFAVGGITLCTGIVTMAAGYELGNYNVFETGVALTTIGAASLSYATVDKKHGLQSGKEVSGELVIKMREQNISHDNYSGVQQTVVAMLNNQKQAKDNNVEIELA